MSCNDKRDFRGHSTQSGGYEFHVGAAPLGIVTKTSSPLVRTGFAGSKQTYYSIPETVAAFDIETGEYSPVSWNSKKLINEIVETPKDYRANRWALKSAVNKILPGSRTSKCMVFRAPDGLGGVCKTVDIVKSKSLKKASYKNLMSCGSVWNCPICAAKVSERRRIELKEALDVARSKNWGIHFVTLTIPHGVGDDLNEILLNMRGAVKRLSSGKYSIKSTIKKIDPNNEMYGFIRAKEVTHGKQNGFHPHIHMIVFTDKNLKSSALETIYKKSWLNACRLASLPVPSDVHGCTVKDGSFASEYISKWGIEDEMTKANSKVSKNKGVTPFGLLRCYLDGDEEYTKDEAKKLFLVYSNAFKGQRQLYWSNGLRKLLDLSVELTDEELAAKEEDQSVLLAQLTFEEWTAIRSQKQEAQVLTVAELAPNVLKQYISNLLSSRISASLRAERRKEDTTSDG